MLGENERVRVREALSQRVLLQSGGDGEAMEGLGMRLVMLEPIEGARTGGA